MAAENKAAATPPPAGIYVPVPTFFAARASAAYDPVAMPLDLDAQGAHAVYLARAGIRGLVVLGSTGEAIFLHASERAHVLSAVRAALDAAGFPDYPIVAGTATQNIAETVEQLRAARDAGAQWGLCLAPGYFAAATSQEGIVRWFTAVADQSPIPVLVYVVGSFPAASSQSIPRPLR